MPALIKGLPFLLAKPTGLTGLIGMPTLIPTLKAGFALKFFWLTAILAGTGFLLFGYSRPEFQDRMKKNYDKACNWVKGIGKDEEWDRFFEENGTA